MSGINWKVGGLTHKFPRPYEGIYGGGSKTITGNRYVDIFATSILGYKIYGNTIQKLLPEEYTQLESITFPSGAYIKTGIIPKTYDLEVGFKGAFSVTSGGPNCAWGYMLSGSNNIPRWLCATHNSKYLLNANTTVAFGTTDTDTHTFIGRVYEKNGIKYWSSELDGVIEQDDQTLGSTDTWETNTLEIYIGARNNSGTAGNYGSITANHWWCKKAGVMIANYVPAKRISDNVIGMYDLVSNTFFTNAGTGTFTAGPTATPTPEIPIEVKGVGDSQLPNGYTLLEYIQSTGTQYIDTGINGTAITRFKLKGFCAPYGVSNTQLIGGTLNSAITFYGARIMSGVASWYALNSESKPLVPASHWAETDATIVSTTSQTGTIKDIDTNETFEFVKFTSSTWGFPNENLLIFGGDSGRRSLNAKVSFLELYTSQGLVANYIPAKRNSDNVIGMYDLVSNTFFTNAGTGSFVAGPEMYQIPVNVSGKNLFDIANADIIEGAYIDADGSIVTLANAVYTGAYIPVKPNTTYTWSGKDGGATINYAICEYDADKTFIERHSRHTSLDDDTWTTKANTYFLRFNLKKSDTRTTLQLEEGSTATPYEPYKTPTTTNIYTNSQLHKVGDYKDVLNSNGTITRNVGVKILTGTENWEKQEYSTGNIGFRSRITDRVQSKSEVICSHYKYSNLVSSNAPNNSIVTFTSVNFDIKDNRFATAEDFKAFLAQQYAAGTPVIIYYQLATPTTETITAPEITLSGEGTYHIEIDTEVDATFDLTYN